MSFDQLERSHTEGSRVYLYLFEPDGGVLHYAYTSDASPITIAGKTYAPHPISHSERKQSGATEAAPEQLTISVPFDNPVAAMHVPFLPPRPVIVTVFAYQRRDMTIELIQEFKGPISNFSQRGEVMELYARPLGDSMQQPVPYAVQKKGCIWNTYGPGCELDRNNFKVVGTVVSTAATTLESAALASKPNGWFTAGYAENTATGEVRFITEHTGNLVKLNYPFIGLANGVTINFYAGDDHQPETCRVKFNNKGRYVGFDKFPTFNVFIQGTYNGGSGGGSGGNAGGPPVGPGERPFQLSPF